MEGTVTIDVNVTCDSQQMLNDFANIMGITVNRITMIELPTNSTITTIQLTILGIYGTTDSQNVVQLLIELIHNNSGIEICNGNGMIIGVIDSLYNPDTQQTGVTIYQPPGVHFTISQIKKEEKISYLKGKGKITSPTEIQIALIEDGFIFLSAKNILIATYSNVSSISNIKVMLNFKKKISKSKDI